jgi:tetratricopeptide (TPR) repeat protein
LLDNHTGDFHSPPMSDRPRQVPHTAPRDLAGDAEAADREGRIEQLLLAGLDQYFAGRLDEAIDVWTRVAFLDRRNTRAKAYIDRARGLVAERQREVEALVYEGVEAYQAGNLLVARSLLTRAVDRGGHSDTAQLFLERLQRSETLPPPPSVPAPRHAATWERPATAAVWSWLATAAVSAALALAILVVARPVASFVAELPLVVPAAAPAGPPPLPVARASDSVLERARSLRAQGRRVEALRVLGRVDVADGQRGAADALRADIQREILAGVEAADAAREVTR